MEEALLISTTSWTGWLLVFMRIVHVFDMRDGKIAKEKVFEMRQPVETEVELDALVELAKVGPWQPGQMAAEPPIAS